MSRSATSSERRRTRARALAPAFSLALALALAMIGAAAAGPALATASSAAPGPVPAAPAPEGSAATGQVYLTKEEALELAFAGCEVERSTLVLTKKELARAAKLAGEKIPSAIAYAYTATVEGKPAGTAYFDAHRVRTLGETIMVVVDPEQRVKRIELLAFAEPPEYAPRGAWYAQFHGRVLDDELNLKRAIRGISGATLTARATTSAVRRLLAVHQVLEERTPDPDDGPAAPPADPLQR